MKGFVKFRLSDHIIRIVETGVSAPPNIYLLLGTIQNILIDTGLGRHDLYEFLKDDLGDRKLVILISSGHFDHFNGLSSFKKAQTFVHALDYQGVLEGTDLNDVRRLYYRKIKTIPYAPTNICWIPANAKFYTAFLKLSDGINLFIIHTPGYSPGACCFYVPKFKAMFTGDTFFDTDLKNVLTSFPPCDVDEWKKSVEKLTTIQEDYDVYPGHGDDLFGKEDLVQKKT
jgi:hydroxyacylglutathione hydrolase